VICLDAQDKVIKEIAVPAQTESLNFFEKQVYIDQHVKGGFGESFHVFTDDEWNKCATVKGFEGLLKLKILRFHFPRLNNILVWFPFEFLPKLKYLNVPPTSLPSVLRTKLHNEKDEEVLFEVARQFHTFLKAAGRTVHPMSNEYHRKVYGKCGAPNCGCDGYLRYPLGETHHGECSVCGDDVHRHVIIGDAPTTNEWAGAHYGPCRESNCACRQYLRHPDATGVCRNCGCPVLRHTRWELPASSASTTPVKTQQRK